MIKIAACLTATLALLACSNDKGPTDASETAAVNSVPALSQLWVADGFDAPEGVAQLPDGHFVISNVNGESTDKDGNGYLSLLNASGEILERQWVIGLDGPKGMAVLHGHLYVADIDRVQKIEIATGSLVASIPVDGAIFLNDVGVWNDRVYVSDSRGATIYRLEGDTPAVWRQGDALRGVNGVLGTAQGLLVSTMSNGDLLRATSDAATGDFETLATGMIDADGIGIVPDGGYLVSAWRGEIYFVGTDGAVTSLLNTRDEPTFQNDLSVFGTTVIVPNWQPGTVTAWTVAN